jgi:hypothetical protein
MKRISLFLTLIVLSSTVFAQKFEAKPWEIKIPNIHTVTEKTLYSLEKGDEWAHFKKKIYNKAGLLIEEQTYFRNKKHGYHSKHYTYDPNGQLIKMEVKNPPPPAIGTEKWSVPQSECIYRFPDNRIEKIELNYHGEIHIDTFSYKEFSSTEKEKSTTILLPASIVRKQGEFHKRTVQLQYEFY